MATFHPSSPSLVLALCAVLLMLFVAGVEGDSSGAPEESCGDMLPVHTHQLSPVLNQTCNPCPTLEVVGYEGKNTFTYTCGISYTCMLHGVWRRGMVLLRYTHMLNVSLTLAHHSTNSFNAVTAAVNSIMVEAREATDSFNSSAQHVGLFRVEGSTDLHTVCQGVRTQHRIS